MPRGRPRDKVLQLRLTESELEALRAISDRRGWTCAQLLRDLVRRELLRAQERGDLLDFEMSLPALARDLKREGYMKTLTPNEEVQAFGRRLKDDVEKEKKEDLENIAEITAAANTMQEALDVANTTQEALIEQDARLKKQEEQIAKILELVSKRMGLKDMNSEDL